MANFRLEKIDQTHAKRIETKEEVVVIDVEQLRQQKDEIESEIAQKNQEHENEIARLDKQLVDINDIIGEFEKLP